MTPVNFPEANTRFGPPVDLEESQCMTIPAYLGSVNNQDCVDGANVIVVAWKPSQEELNILMLGGSIYLSVLGGLPPHFLCTDFVTAINPR